MKSIILTLLFLIAVAAGATAATYQYTDETGKTGFTDDLSQVPKSQRNTAKIFDSVPVTTDTSGTNSSELEKILYYDRESNIKIILSKGFLLKITRNENGLKRVTELGSYPDAYPENLPDPGTHVEPE